jgi:hypothetical protein
LNVVPPGRRQGRGHGYGDAPPVSVDLSFKNILCLIIVRLLNIIICLLILHSSMQLYLLFSPF